MIAESTPPTHDSLTVLDRRVDALPTEKCDIQIFADGEWVAGVWNPRTPESKTDTGYLGTVWASVPCRIGSSEYVAQIGLHAWEQNESEFLFYCLPTRS